MALQFTTTRDASRLHGVKVLVHGRAGSGKTRLCATAPAPLILSAEAGLLSLQDENIPVITITTIAELDEAYQFCAYSEHAKQFQTICLDSISEIAEVCLTNEKKLSKDPRKAYGEMQDKMIDRVRWFRDLPGKHVYFSAKQGSVKDEMTGVTLYGPSAPGQKVGPALPYLFDEVFSLETAKSQDGKTYNYLRTGRDLQFEAKDRSGRLDPFEPPNLTTIFEKILGKAA
jgi:hypothetical protein